MEEEPDSDQVAAGIIEYLSRYPEAADSAEGIRQFWFRDSPMKPAPALVQAALDELVSREVVAVWTGATKQKIYGAAKRSGF